MPVLRAHSDDQVLEDHVSWLPSRCCNAATAISPLKGGDICSICSSSRLGFFSSCSRRFLQHLQVVVFQFLPPVPRGALAAVACSSHVFDVGAGQGAAEGIDRCLECLGIEFRLAATQLVVAGLGFLLGDRLLTLVPTDAASVSPSASARASSCGSHSSAACPASRNWQTASNNSALRLPSGAPSRR